MKLHVEIKGKGDPILCLHGHPGSSKSLTLFTDHLCQNYLTLSPDLRGYGKSKVSQPFQMTDHLEDLSELLETHKIERSLLLGWSLGGILALELLLKHPDRFNGLILIASAARPYGNHPPISWQDLAFTGIAGLINQFKPGWQWNINTFGKRSLFRYLFSQQTPEPYQYLARDGVSAFLQTSRPADKALNHALKQGYNRLDQINSLQIPVLVLAGENDRHITAASSQITAQSLPNCQWKCYPQTAHLFPWEIPQQVLADVDLFLEQVVNSDKITGNSRDRAPS